MINGIPYHEYDNYFQQGNPYSDRRWSNGYWGSAWDDPGLREGYKKWKNDQWMYQNLSPWEYQAYMGRREAAYESVADQRINAMLGNVGMLTGGEPVDMFTPSGQGVMDMGPVTGAWENIPTPPSFGDTYNSLINMYL